MGKLPEAKIILVFNPRKKLIAIFNSALAAAKALDMRTASICNACNGINIASGGYYFRYLSSNIEVTNEDLGLLTLIEYDMLCGIKRKVYDTTKMRRQKKNKQ